MYPNFAVVYYMNCLIGNAFNHDVPVVHVNPAQWQPRGGRGGSKKRARSFVIKMGAKCNNEHEYDASCMVMKVAEGVRNGKFRMRQGQISKTK